jgi:mono/diheme cytochrome c family protein
MAEPLHKPEPPATYVEAHSRWRRRIGLLVVIVLVMLMLIGLATVVLGVYAKVRSARNSPVTYSENVPHFLHGSIGAEPESGLPYWVWQALPRLFPEAFEGRLDYRAFGFLYETRPDGTNQDLPVGISKRNYQGVDVVWFNCAVCHTGAVRTSEAASPQIVPGMPANHLDLYRFIRFVLDAGVDERLKAERLIPAMKEAGATFGPVDKLLWTYYIVPRVREGFIERRSRLAAFMADQAPWGPGRVDTFNPYKLVNFQMGYAALTPAERYGASDFPSIFNQRPREGMNLHWDGNNDSLAERNLSAALGAGVTVKTVDHASIERVATWLLDLPAPTSPHKPDPAAVARGKPIFMRDCAACHGYRDESGYKFEGANLGKVLPNANLGTDPGRLDSYTEAFRQRQINELFAGTPYQFSHFKKTNGYANMPLDGLWVRAPYLHNGAIPTLRDLLSPQSERPAAYVRGLDIVDGKNGGFVAPRCEPGKPVAQGFCYDTRLPGNRNGGHVYGTTLPAGEKEDLLAYLLTF